MLCSCRLSTDKRVTWSLCHSRASCIYTCEIYFISYYRKCSLYNQCRMLKNYHTDHVICVLNIYKCSYVFVISKVTNQSNFVVILSWHRQTLLTPLKTTNKVQFHGYRVPNIFIRNIHVTAICVIYIYRENMKMGKVTIQHICWDTCTLPTLVKLTSFHATVTD